MNDNLMLLPLPTEGPIRNRTVPAKATVLVVEDDDEMRAWVEETLREAGYRTSGAEDAFAALLTLMGGGVDAIVTDWRMPTMDGLELLDALHRCSLTVPVVFVTAFPYATLRLEALERGAIRFLAKPFGGHQLVENVRSALRRQES